MKEDPAMNMIQSAKDQVLALTTAAYQTHKWMIIQRA